MIVVMLFLLAIVFSLKPCPDSDYLEREKTISFRGVLAVAICFAHTLTYDNGNAILRFCFTAANAPFLFYSGYGLASKTQESMKNRGGYLNHFFKKRLARIICTVIIVNVIYVTVKVLHQEYAELRYVNSIIGDLTDFGWFTTIIIVYYIFFFIIYYRKLGDDYKYNILIYAFFLCSCFLICRYIGLSSVWYGNSVAFLLGLIWARYRDVIDEIIENHYTLLLICIIVLHVCGNVVIILRENQIISIPGVGMIAVFMLAIVYPVLWNLLLMKYTFKFGIWHFIGIISYEVYMTQKWAHPTAQLIMRIINFQNYEFYALLSLITGMVYSIFVYWLYGQFKKTIFR